jgi:glutamine synthetase
MGSGGPGTGVVCFAGTCDLAGIVRGRAVPGSREAELLQSGVGWVPADLGLTCFGGIAEKSPFDSSGDLLLMPDPATRADIGPRADRPGLRIYLADQLTVDGAVWSCCPRGFLRQVLEDLRREAGLKTLVSFEHEFVLAEMTGTHPFSLGRLRACEPFGSALLDLLEAAGLGPETWLPEYGAGQFEITVTPSGGLEAADRAVILRELVRDLARSMRLSASFAPLATLAGVGSGVHIHFSLITDNGVPALFEAGAPGSLSVLGRTFAAGVLRHAPALAALTVGSAASFLRLRPHRWSAAGIALAERDREGLLRICPGVLPDDGRAAAAMNLEYRAADATANPWIALGSLLRAGLTGILAGYPPADVVPAGLMGPAMDAIGSLPGDQAAALAALEDDQAARSWLPPDLLEAYLAVKNSELSAVAGLDEEQLCKRFADVY